MTGFLSWVLMLVSDPVCGVIVGVYFIAHHIIWFLFLGPAVWFSYIWLRDELHSRKVRQHIDQERLRRLHEKPVSEGWVPPLVEPDVDWPRSPSIESTRLAVNACGGVSAKPAALQVELGPVDAGGVMAPMSLTEAQVGEFLDQVLKLAGPAPSTIVVRRGGCTVITAIGQQAKDRGISVMWQKSGRFEDCGWVLSRS